LIEDIATAPDEADKITELHHSLSRVASASSAVGYAVAGKRPDAVFFEQLVRSPIVRSTTKSGYHGLDLDVFDQLYARLRAQQTKLAELMAMPLPISGKHVISTESVSVSGIWEIARPERELDVVMTAIEAWRNGLRSLTLRGHTRL
jgi:hypothetical protein